MIPQLKQRSTWKDIVEQVGIACLEEYGRYSENIVEVSVGKQTENQDQNASTQKGVKIIIKDRDPKGMNDMR